jgi:hypothetical protein
MKKLPTSLFILLGIIVVILMIKYVFWYYENNFAGFPPNPDPLYKTTIPGHAEGIEQALMQVYTAENLSVTYRNGNYSEISLVQIPYQNDIIGFEFAIYYCRQPKDWVNDDWMDNCNHSIITLHRIRKNGHSLFYDNDDKQSYQGIEPYIELFKSALINKAKINMQHYPDYTWVKKYNSDSTEASVLVLVANTNDTIAEHKFVALNPNYYIQIYYEKYYNDTTISYEYDLNGHYLESKFLKLPEGGVRKVY